MKAPASLSDRFDIRQLFKQPASKEHGPHAFKECDNSQK